jgi:hypothetical protein
MVSLMVRWFQRAPLVFSRLFRTARRASCERLACNRPKNDDRTSTYGLFGRKHKGFGFHVIL